MSERCVWREDENGDWYTDCGEQHEFLIGRPFDNLYYCPYCGRDIIEKPYLEHREEKKEISND